MEIEGSGTGLVLYKTNEALMGIMRDWLDPSKRADLVAKYGNIEDW
jgi:hypothetical protein